MYRILVFSDTHKSIDACIATIDNIIGVNMIIHAGDHAGDARELEKLYPDIPVRYVRGNCDFSSEADEIIVEVCDKKIFVTHGHNYNVKNEHDYRSLKLRTFEAECDAVVFGHTHIPFCEKFSELTIINPGSVKYGRTFGVIEIEEDKIKAAICDCNHIM